MILFRKISSKLSGWIRIFFLNEFCVDQLRVFCRIFLYKFILPGEAQKIERIMTVFAQRYYECNPDMFANSGRMKRFSRFCFFSIEIFLLDVCFILSYAIIMLNTSLHNKNAKMGGPFTFDMFLNSLNGTKEKEFMPETSVIKVTKNKSKTKKRIFLCDF